MLNATVSTQAIRDPGNRLAQFDFRTIAWNESSAIRNVEQLSQLFDTLSRRCRRIDQAPLPLIPSPSPPQSRGRREPKVLGFSRFFSMRLRFQHTDEFLDDERILGVAAPGNQ